MREILFSAALMIVGSNWKDVEKSYVKCKYTLESKGLKVNVKKTKAIKIGTKL